MGKRGYRVMSRAAMELLFVENVLIPPPRNKKPVAKLTYSGIFVQRKFRIENEEN